ncbi:hypothetical protein HU200_067430 [Digitaria exilis]|uniref:Longin domain-containing protein n=1 Tax=Digitaria exilis TaxID=1010633 RepID=A0A835DSX7_9POAL|nr:hypothetical protein HU200_067430 [Digitaria exilis]
MTTLPNGSRIFGDEGVISLTQTYLISLTQSPNMVFISPTQPPFPSKTPPKGYTSAGGTVGRIVEKHLSLQARPAGSHRVASRPARDSPRTTAKLASHATARSAGERRLASPRRHPILTPSCSKAPSRPDPAMKITALLVLKSPGGGSSSSSTAPGGEQQAVVLANASDVSHFGYFQRAAAREFILFVARTVALRTPAGRRQSVQHEGKHRTHARLLLPSLLRFVSSSPDPSKYMVHCYNQNGLCAIAFTDDHYPVRSAFSLLNMP